MRRRSGSATIGRHGTSWLNLSAIAINYRISPHFSFGGRLDFDHDFTTQPWFIPLLVNTKCYFGPATHFLSADRGYSLGLKKEDGETAYGGWTVTPAARVAIRLGNRTGLHLSIGYRTQWLPEYIYTGGYSEKPFRSGSVLVRMAFALYIPRY